MTLIKVEVLITCRERELKIANQEMSVTAFNILITALRRSEELDVIGTHL